MRQVLFRLPIHTEWSPDGIPLYGFGLMLFLTFLVTTWLAGRRARQAGVDPQHLQDLAIWIFVCGIVCARIVYMVQYGEPIDQFFRIWQGGLVFYGSAIGGIIGGVLGYWFVIRKHQISFWKLADIVAPCVAIGLVIGRIGCLLNGCCYGNVAYETCPGITFPLSAPPRFHLVGAGFQTAAGFTMAALPGADDRMVGAVAADSPAADAGLRPGDVIVRANDQPIKSYADLYEYLGRGENWPRGLNDLRLGVIHAGETVPVELPAIAPRSLRLNPTQLYESISMALLFLVLLAFTPVRRREGMVMAVFLIGYAIHRFINETLRNDTKPIQFDGFQTHMTLSQNLSLLFFVMGVTLVVYLCRRSARGSRSGIPCASRLP
jgi:prolipoprotein diacylglyceryltransferase